jgi:glutamate racemase
MLEIHTPPVVRAPTVVARQLEATSTRPMIVDTYDLAMIGIFDSGLGGLGVATQVRHLLPWADILYVGDRAHAPYGERTLEEVSRLSEEITDHLVVRGCHTIVIACNTASAAALHHLRRLHPDTTFVGMEPAVKPAAAISQTGVIAVLATAATFQSELFESLVDRFAPGVEVIRHVCRDWVERVEQGLLADPSTQNIVARDVESVVAAQADVMVLGCTHYPFLRPLIQQAAGQSVTVIDPAPAVAQQVSRVADPRGTGRLTIEVTGEHDGLSELVERLTGLALPTSTVTLGS